MLICLLFISLPICFLFLEYLYFTLPQVFDYLLWLDIFVAGMGNITIDT